jgi:hypothetical protein
MHKILKLGFVILLVLCMAIIMVGPTMADDGYTKIQDGFTVDPSQHGVSIAQGSTIYHLANGVTDVYSVNGEFELEAMDSEANTVSTPDGLEKATFVYNVPSGSHITAQRNVCQVYDSGIIILTVVNTIVHPSTSPPATYWLESSQDTNVNNLGYDVGTWITPKAPTLRSGITDFLFNGIQGSGTIIQPVLEWNQAGSGRWTGAAWWAGAYGSFRSTPINVKTGDTIDGAMEYVGGANGWYVDFQDNSTGQNTDLSTDLVGTSNVLACCTLEASSAIQSKTDIPGSTTFSNMVFQYQSQNVNVVWTAYYSLPPGLTKSGLGLNVDIVSSSEVILQTGNN